MERLASTTEHEAERLGVTVLGSGSRGNAIVVSGPGGGILFDAGFSGRELHRRLREADISPSVLQAIVVSHEHSDHVSGLRVTAKRLGVPVYSNRGTASAIRHREDNMGPMHVFSAGAPFRVADLTIEPFSIPHDATDPVGFAIHWRDRKIGLATDLGHASHLICYQLQGCDALIVESNHDVRMLQNSRRPWTLKQRILGRHGHLSNDTSMDLLRRVVTDRTRHIVLAHASEECNRYDLIEQCARECLDTLGRGDIEPLVATQNAVLPTVWIERRAT